MSAEIKPNHEGECVFEGVKPRKEGNREERTCNLPGCEVTAKVHIAKYETTDGRDRWRE